MAGETMITTHTLDIQGGFLQLWTLLTGWTAGVVAQCDYYQDMSAGDMFYVYSPGYPDHYTSGSRCRWYAVAPRGTRISLVCNDFDLPSTIACSGDRLSVSTTGDLDLLDGHNYCGRGKFTETSAGNKMNIVLATTANSLRGRFSCSIAAVPAGGVTTTTQPPPSNCNCGWRQKTRIVGGTETGVNEYPMMAGLIDGNLRVLYCGATIISERFVVTAAHCLIARLPSEVAVLVGDHDITSGTDTTATELILSEKFTTHPQFDSASQVNDIALIRLSRDVTFSKNVGPACLPFRFKSNTFAGEPVTVLGWGRTEFGGPMSNALKQTQLNAIPLSECKAAHPSEVISDKQICTFYQDTDACQSDSGGPLLWQDPNTGRLQLVGIISYGIGCASDKPGVNTRVSSYVDWITQVTQGDYCIK